jgi:hypothetical protein
VLGLVVVAAGCAPSTGGCAPFDDGGATTTTEAGGSTTTEPDDATTTTSTTVVDGSTSSTTTTVDPGGSTTTLPDGSTTTTTVPGDVQAVAVDSLQVEDCFVPSDDDTFVAEVRIVDCEVPHKLEVFAQYEMEELDEWVGSDEITWAAQDECQARFEDYVGHDYWTSDFDVRTLTPSFSTWSEGDRAITCLIENGDGTPLTSSARNAGR